MVAIHTRKGTLILVTLALAFLAFPAMAEEVGPDSGSDLVLASGPAALDLHPAAATIRGLGGEAMTALADPALAPEEKIRFFRDLLARALDVPLVARLALGRRWNEVPAERREAYVATFRDYMLNRYAGLLGGSAPIERFEVEETRPVGQAEVMVHTLIQRGQEKPIRVSWRLHQGVGSYRIVDLVVEGVSFLVAQRKEFDAVLRSGGDIDGLIALLKKKSA